MFLRYLDVYGQPLIFNWKIIKFSNIFYISSSRSYTDEQEIKTKTKNPTKLTIKIVDSVKF